MKSQLFPQNRPAQQQIEQQIGLEQTNGVRCQECDGILFQQFIAVRKVPRVLVGAPTDQHIMLPVLCCAQCNAPLQELLPPGLPEFENQEPAKPTELTPTSRLLL